MYPPTGKCCQCPLDILSTIVLLLANFSKGAREINFGLEPVHEPSLFPTSPQRLIFFPGMADIALRLKLKLMQSPASMVKQSINTYSSLRMAKYDSHFVCTQRKHCLRFLPHVLLQASAIKSEALVIGHDPCSLRRLITLLQ